jgi:hypothetical protein
MDPQLPTALNTSGQPSSSSAGDRTGLQPLNFITSPETPQIIRKFLADRLTNPPADAAAASQAAPVPKKTQ